MSILLYIICIVPFLLFGIVVFLIYKYVYLRPLSYVIHREVEKELELPPLGKDWDYNEEEVQSTSNILIDISD